MGELQESTRALSSLVISLQRLGVLPDKFERQKWCARCEDCEAERQPLSSVRSARSLLDEMTKGLERFAP
jgi:hypothetical protein